MTEGVRRQAERQRLPSDRDGRKIDRQGHVQARHAGNRRPQLGECLAVAHPDRAADLDRRSRRFLRNDPGTIQQEHERRRGAVEDRRLRSIDLDHGIVDAAARKCRHHMFDGADPRIAVREHRGETGVNHAIEARRDVDADVGAAEHDPMIHRSRPERQARAVSLMQPNADTAYRRLQRLLAPRGRVANWAVRQSVHGLVSIAVCGPSPVNVCF